MGRPQLSGKTIKTLAVALPVTLLVIPFMVLVLAVAGVSFVASSVLAPQNNCGAATVAVPVSTVTGSPSAEETANVRIIIGVAKTENLPVNAEIAAVATMLVESAQGLVLANENVPLSESNPHKQGDGSNGVSLGLFQQQITDGWSTILPPSISNAAGVNQLMTASYEAEAFFGVPPGTAIPTSVANPAALTKGLQDQPNYATSIATLNATAIGSLDQEVQGSEYPNRYEKHVNAASAIVDANQDAPAVPLPVPINATAASSSASGGSGSGISSGTPSSVLVVGDSITIAGSHDLAHDLNTASVNSTFADQAGAGLSTFMNPSNTKLYIPGLVRASNPGLLVIALGTNDYGDSTSYPKQMNALFGSIPSTQPVLWVLPYYQDIQPGSYAHMTPGLKSLDSVIQAQTAAHSNMTTLDMNAVFGTNASYIGPGGLNPNAAGQAVWANAISQAIVSSPTVAATTACTAQSTTTSNSTGGYQNPMRSVTNLVDERVDMGVDFAGTGPVYAVGAGTVTYVKASNSGWPGTGARNGGFIQYTLSAGPAAGLNIYLAECITPTVTVGQKVTATTVIGNMTNCGSGIETGWGSSTPTLTMASQAKATIACQPHQYCSGQWNRTLSTAYGENFAQLLNELGQSTLPATTPINGTIPANWPAWVVTPA